MFVTSLNVVSDSLMFVYEGLLWAFKHKIFRPNLLHHVFHCKQQEKQKTKDKNSTETDVAF